MNADAMVLLMPEKMQRAALGGAAELIVEERPGSGATRRHFLHIFDDSERADKLSGAAASGVPEAERRVHEQRLKEFRWACSTIWGEDSLRAFLGCPDPTLWPELDSLGQAIDTVRQLIRYQGPASSSAGDGDKLSRAFGIVERETRYAGVHPLRKAPVAGQLVPYEVDQWLRSTGSVSMSMPDTLTRGEGDKDALRDCWLVEPSTPALMAADALRLPMTQRTVGRLVELVHPTIAASPQSAPEARRVWQSLMDAHTQSLLNGAVALAGSVADAAAAFHTTERVIAQLAHHAAEESHARVRIRVGVFITVVHRPLLFLVCGRDPKGLLTAEEKESFRDITGLDFAALQAAGLVRIMAPPLERAEVDEAVQRSFLSPAWHTTQDSGGGVGPSLPYQVDELVQDDASSLRVHKITAAHNPFLVVHGPRVLNGATGSEALSGLLKRRREAEMDADFHHSVDAIATDEEATRRAPKGSSAAAQLSTGLRGEELHAAIGRAVVAALAVEPLSKAALSSHSTLAPFSRLREFDSILKETLKTHAEYKGRKYVLRQ